MPAPHRRRTRCHTHYQAGSATTLATDASELPIGGEKRATWAWWSGPTLWQAGTTIPGDIFQAETVALLHALQFAYHHLSGPVVVLCDNQPLVGAVNRPRRALRGPALRQQLLRACHTLLACGTISVTWVPGHTGNPIHTPADTLARRIAEQVPNGPRHVTFGHQCPTCPTTAPPSH